MGQEFKPYLPALDYHSISRTILSTSAPMHVEFKGSILNADLIKVSRITDVISQMYNIFTPYKKGSLPGQEGSVPELSFSHMVVPDGLFGVSSNNPYGPSGEEYSLTQINNILNVLNPSDLQVGQISWFTVDASNNLKFNKLGNKKFYATMLQLIQNSNDPLFSEYKTRLSGQSLTNLDISTEEEYQTIHDLDMILSEIFSYEGLTMLQLGMLSIQRSSEGLFVQPLTFHPSYIQEIANQFGFRAANAKDTLIYETMKATSLVDFLISSLVSGNYKIFKVRDSQGNIGMRKVFSYPGPAILSILIENFQGNYESHTYHGQIRRQFRNKFLSSITSPLSSSYKVIQSKQSLYSIFAGFIDTQINSRMLLNWVHLNPQFAIGTDNWVNLLQRYIKIQYRESIMRARRSHDPIILSKRLIMLKYTNPGTSPQYSLRLSPSRGGNTFYSQASINIDANKLYDNSLDIQYSLQFDYDHIGSSINSHLIDAVFSDIDENILHTYDNLCNILNEYSQINDDQTFTAFFYRETAAGLPSRSGLKYTVYSSASTNFDRNTEIQGTSFEFKLLKNDGSNIIDFIKSLSSILHYMVKYDCLVMIKESTKGDTTAKYALIASLQEMYDDSYLVSLNAVDDRLKAQLSTFAKSRLSSWRGGYASVQGPWINGWNRDVDPTVRFWKDSNTYSFYMFDDADMFASKIARLFGVKYATGDFMFGLHRLS